MNHEVLLVRAGRKLASSLVARLSNESACASLFIRREERTEIEREKRAPARGYDWLYTQVDPPACSSRLSLLHDFKCALTSGNILTPHPSSLIRRLTLANEVLNAEVRTLSSSSHRRRLKSVRQSPDKGFDVLVAYRGAV